MSTPVTYNGVSYSIPAYQDTGWAQGPGNLSSYLIALASGSLQQTGGLFSLTAQANFGPSFGLTAANFTSVTAIPATAGAIRLANTDTIDWRNFANTGNLLLGVNVTDQLTYQGIPLSTTALNGTVSAGIAGRLTLYPATGNTVDDVYIQNGFGINVLIATQAARSIALEYTIPNPGNAVAAATFVLLELAQIFTAAQVFAATVTISATTNQLVLGTTNTVTITSPAPAASRVYTIPDVLGPADFVMTAGNQTIGGIKTFNGGVGAITMSGSTIAMGANKITGLANGTAATDAAAFGQIPVITPGQIVGTATNDNATAGNVGEYIESVISIATNFPATGIYGDLTSISIPAGDWTVDGGIQQTANGATVSEVSMGVSSNAGNTVAGLIGGSNRIDGSGAISGVRNAGFAIPSFRVSLAGTTTYYLKYESNYTVATPQATGRLSARRAR